MMTENQQASSGSPVLTLSGISKKFGPAYALQNVNFRLFPGEIHALMGQNGAGKSTLIKVLTGVFLADEGNIHLNNKVIKANSTLEAQQLGISTVYQEVNLCPNLSVAENIFAGRYPRKDFKGAWGIDWKRMYSDAREVLGRLNIDIDVTETLSHYSVAIQQMVAIARGLSISSQVLILDEPTSSLDDEEVSRLFDVLRQLRSEGMATLFVTHFLDQVYAISDRITVLRNGELVGEYKAAELNQNALIAAMVGREFASNKNTKTAANKTSTEADVFVQTKGLNKRGQLKNLDFNIRRGEVVGIAGLLGSGRTEFARLLFGLTKRDGGEIIVNGKSIKIDSAVDAINLGFGLCPEDRKAEGIIGELSVRENIALALQARKGLWPCLSVLEQTTLAQSYVDSLGIKTFNVDTPINQLSGGNQQKALLARWLATKPNLLILDEPTRGIDIAAKQEIMNEILALADKGMSVIFISSEMEEVVRLSDRIVVLRDHAGIGELAAGCTEHDVYSMIAGQA